MRKTDLAYVAGIIDGEGSIGIYPNYSRGGRPHYQMVIRVVNTNEWLIQWLSFSFGGYNYISRDNNLARSKNWKPQWQWVIASNKALEFLKQIVPYLRLKRPQAELAVKFQETRRGSGHKLTDEEVAVNEAQRILMSSYNKRGLQKTEKGGVL